MSGPQVYLQLVLTALRSVLDWVSSFLVGFGVGFSQHVSEVVTLA